MITLSKKYYPSGKLQAAKKLLMSGADHTAFKFADRAITPEEWPKVKRKMIEVISKRVWTNWFIDYEVGGLVRKKFDTPQEKVAWDSYVNKEKAKMSKTSKKELCPFCNNSNYKDSGCCNNPSGIQVRETFPQARAHRLGTESYNIGWFVIVDTLTNKQLGQEQENVRDAWYSASTGMPKIIQDPVQMRKVLEDPLAGVHDLREASKWALKEIDRLTLYL